MVYEYPPNSPGKSLRPARDPVLMLQQNVLTRSEETERSRGFPMNMGMDKNEQQFFSGLFSLNSTAGTEKSYECLTTINTAIAVLAKAREFSDPQTLTTRENRNRAPPPRRRSLRDTNHQEFDDTHDKQQQ